MKEISATEFTCNCQEAEGYITLGMLEDAANILEDLPTDLKITKEVISLQMHILVKAGKYLKASYLAETLCTFDPGDVDRWVMVARYRYKAGEFALALQWLAFVRSQCEADAYFHYLAAQCLAALARNEDAANSLKAATALNADFGERALDDPRFEFLFGADRSSS